MRRTNVTGRVFAMGAAGIACAGMALAGQAGMKLLINGSVASERVRVIGGEFWVPMKDVARALGMTVSTKAGSIELAREGGAN